LQTVEEIVADDDDVGATCGPTFAGGNRLDAGSRNGQGWINTCGKKLKYGQISQSSPDKVQFKQSKSRYERRYFTPIKTNSKNFGKKLTKQKNKNRPSYVLSGANG
jgi:hypothetical protein